MLFHFGTEFQKFSSQAIPIHILSLSLIVLLTHLYK